MERCYELTGGIPVSWSLAFRPLRAIWACSVQNSGRNRPRRGTAPSEPSRHEGVAGAGRVIAERTARLEARLGVEGAGRPERTHRARLQAHAVVAAVAGHGDEVVDHRPAQAGAPGGGSGVHRLQLAVAGIELPEG